jgi:hypothetical protein
MKLASSLRKKLKEYGYFEKAGKGVCCFDCSKTIRKGSLYFIDFNPGLLYNYHDLCLDCASKAYL